MLGASAGLPKLGEDKTDASQPSLQEVERHRFQRCREPHPVAAHGTVDSASQQNETMCMVIQLWHRLIWSEQGSVKETSPSRSILFLAQCYSFTPVTCFLPILLLVP